MGMREFEARTTKLKQMKGGGGGMEEMPLVRGSKRLRNEEGQYLGFEHCVRIAIFLTVFWFCLSTIVFH